MTIEPVADCECCGTPLHEGDDYDFIAEGLVWVCRSCVEAEEDRLREEFGWIGVWRGEGLGDDAPSFQPGKVTDAEVQGTTATVMTGDTGGADDETIIHPDGASPWDVGASRRPGRST